MLNQTTRLALGIVIATCLNVAVAHALTNITEKQWNDVNWYTTSGNVSCANGKLSLVSANSVGASVARTDLSIPRTYKLTFKAQVVDYGSGDASLGIKVCDGKYRLMFKRQSGGIYCMTSDSDGAWKWTVSPPGSTANAWTEYRIDVSDGEACFQYKPDNGTWSDWVTISLAENTTADRLEHWTDTDSSTVKFDWTTMVVDDYSAATAPYVFHRTFVVMNGGDQNVADFVILPETEEDPRIIKCLYQDCLSTGEQRMYWTSSADDGFTWTSPMPATFMGEDHDANNIFRTKGGAILRQRRSEYANGSKEIWIERSPDDGISFTGQIIIGNRINPMPGKMVQTTTGRIFLCTASNNGTGDGDEGAKIFFSDDDGVTWVLTYHFDPIPLNVSFGEVDVIELPNGNIRAYGRSFSGHLYTSVSTDADTTTGTSTWSVPVASSLQSPNNSFGLDEDPYNRGVYYMVWTHNTEGPPDGDVWANRNNIALAKSVDGVTWSWVDFISRMPTTNPEGWFKYNNTNLEITPDSLLVFSRRDENNTTAKDFKGHFWRVKKSAIKTKSSFPAVPNPRASVFTTKIAVGDAPRTSDRIKSTEGDSLVGASKMR